MREIHSYVIRIYRRNADVLAGLVEHVQSGRTAAFQSLAELGEVLAARKPLVRPPARRDPFSQAAAKDE